MYKHITKWFFKSTIYMLIGLPITLIGLLAVWIGIKIGVHTEGDEASYTQYPNLGNWKLTRLPKWLLLWDNKYDGLLGDKRGWWANYCLENYGKSNKEPYCMWQWAAIRNPANYWSRVVAGVDVSQCTFTLLAGQTVVDEDNPGWHFIVATRKDGAQFHLLQFVFPWFFDKTHAVYGRFGWKIKMDHQGTQPDEREQDRIKGSVYRVSPWKAIS